MTFHPIETTFLLLLGTGGCIIALCLLARRKGRGLQFVWPGIILLAGLAATIVALYTFLHWVGIVLGTWLLTAMLLIAVRSLSHNDMRSVISVKKFSCLVLIGGVASFFAVLVRFLGPIGLLVGWGSLCIVICLALAYQSWATHRWSQCSSLTKNPSRQRN